MSPTAVAVPPITSTPSAISSVLNNPISSKPALIAPEPAHCPGPESSSAGTSSACAGCPNQSICASQKPKGPDPDIPAISSRLAGVKHKILVLSGKGGVGKSTFSCLLARAFASSSSSASGPDDDDYDDALVSVGLMDADVCGPSIPRMMGVEGESFHVSASGWSPVMAADNLAVMSIQFMLQDRDSAVIWRGPKKNGLLKQFLRDVEWGDLDFLVVDTPPGTSDEHLSLNALLKDTSGGIDGAVVVTTPQEVALLDVRKEIDFCRKAGIRVLGLVENMAGFVCPSCKFTSQIFKATTGGGEKLAKDMGLRFLGRMPLDPRIGMACDYGESFFDAYPDSPAAQALRRVVGGIADELGVEINIVDQDEE